MPARFVPPGECPVCGRDVPPAAAACHECGACPASGWSEQAAYDALELPNDEFHYESFVAGEFGEGRRGPRRPWWMIVAVTGLILLLLGWLLA
jgi:hypothetical protein